MSWFKRDDGNYESGSGDDSAVDAAGKTVRTEGLWIKCLGCRQPIFKPDLEANLNVCPKCRHHFKIGAASASACCSNPATSWWTAACAPLIRSTSPT